MSLDTAIIQQYYAGILRLTPSAATINAYAQLPSYEAAMDAMMNAAVSSVNPITKLYQAAFDRVPDSLGLTNYTAAYGAGAGTMTLQQIATQWTGTIEFTTDYPASMPNADYVGLLYWNVLHRSADPVGAANFTAALNNGTMTRAGVLLELSQSPEFAYLIDGHIQGFQEQCALNDPAAYTGSLWDKVPPGPGETFTLTTGIDVFTATTDNATFNAVAAATAADGSTLTTGDILTGAGGINTLNITGTGVSTALVETHDIQNVSIRAAGAASGFSQLLMEGVDLVSSDRSLFDTTVNGAQMATTYALNNTIAGQDADLFINYQTVAGTADVAKLAVNNAGDKTGSTTTTQTITLLTGGVVTQSVEAVALETAGDNYIVIAAGSGVEEYLVTGSGNNTIQINNNPRSNAQFDLSGATGNNTLDLQRFLTAADTVIGGSGVDTLKIGGTVGSVAGRLQVSGFEALNIGVTTASSGGWGDVTGIDSVTLAAVDFGASRLYTATQLSGVDTVIAASTSLVGEVNALTLTGTSADSVTVNQTATAAALTQGALTLSAGTETVTLNVTGDSDNYVATSEGFSVDGLTTFEVNSTGYTAQVGGTTGTPFPVYNVVISSLNSTADATLAMVDLSGNAYGTDLTTDNGAQFAQNAHIIGGAGIDLIDAALSDAGTGVTNLYITGGAGGDFMTAANYKTTFVIAEGDSGTSAASATAASNIDNIGGFTSGTDKLSLGVAGDSTATTGNFIQGGGAVANYAAALNAANAQLATLAATTQYTQTYSYQYQAATQSYLFVDFDLDGSADAAIILIGLVNAGSFVASDIIA